MFLNFRNILETAPSWVLFYSGKQKGISRAQMRRVMVMGARVVFSALKNVFCFCSSVRNQGTNFAKIHHMFQFFLKSPCHVTYDTLNLPTDSEILFWVSPILRIFSKFSPVRPLEGRPEVSQTSTKVCPRVNLEKHSDVQFPPPLPCGIAAEICCDNVLRFLLGFLTFEAKLIPNALFLQISESKVADRS